MCDCWLSLSDSSNFKTNWTSWNELLHQGFVCRKIIADWHESRLGWYIDRSVSQFCLLTLLFRSVLSCFRAGCSFYGETDQLMKSLWFLVRTYTVAQVIWSSAAWTSYRAYNMTCHIQSCSRNQLFNFWSCVLYIIVKFVFFFIFTGFSRIYL